MLDELLNDLKPGNLIGLALAAIKYKHNSGKSPGIQLMSDIHSVKRFTMLDEIFASPEVYLQGGSATLDVVNAVGLLYNEVRKRHIEDQDIPGKVNDWLENKNKDELIELLLHVDLNSPDLGGKSAGTEILNSLPPMFRGAISLMGTGIEKFGEPDNKNMEIARNSVSNETKELNNLIQIKE